MSIEYRNGDLLRQDDIDVIIHQCNCFCTMNSGIAKQISREFPEVYEADKKTKNGDVTKLGTFSSAIVNKGTDNEKTFINLYSQFYYGLSHGEKIPHTNYEAMEKGLKIFKEDFSSHYTITKEPLVIGVPYLIGCALGGGVWTVVERLLHELFEKDEKFKLVICKLQ